VIIIDDGIATGLTMRAAIKSIKVKNPKKIIVATPCGTKDSLEEIEKEVDKVVCLYVPIFFGAVGAFYKNFKQTTDEEVIDLIQKSKVS
jgi:predicted phosphoribosyltransferase